MLAVHPRQQHPRLYAIAGGHIKLVDIPNWQILPISIPLGKSPRWISVSPDGRRGYVTDRRENVVYIVDLLSLRKVSQIDVGNAPEYIAVTPDGKHAFVSNMGEDNVSVLDLSLGSETEIDVDSDESNGITRIPTGEHPGHLVITPDGRSVYVLSQEAIHVIDVASNSVTGAPIVMATVPRQIAISPDGKYGYVTRGDEVSVIDLSHGKVVDSLKICKYPIWITINSSGTSAYIDCADGLVVVDLKTKKVTNKIQGWDLRWIELAIAPDGQIVYWSNQQLARLPWASAIRVINTADSTEIDTDNDAENGITLIEIGQGTIESIAFAPDGSRAYVLSERGLMIVA